VLVCIIQLYKPYRGSMSVLFPIHGGLCVIQPQHVCVCICHTRLIVAVCIVSESTREVPVAVLSHDLLLG